MTAMQLLRRDWWWGQGEAALPGLVALLLLCQGVASGQDPNTLLPPLQHGSLVELLEFAPLPVTPAGTNSTFYISTNELNFGSVQRGSSRTLSFRISPLCVNQVPVSFGLTSSGSGFRVDTSSLILCNPTDVAVTFTPPAPGRYMGSVRVSSLAQSSTVAVTGEGVDPLVIATTALPRATLGQPYNAQLVASGGVALVEWRLAPGSALPPGLFLSGNVISGSPTQAGEFSFGIQASDGQSTASQTCSLGVTGAPVALGEVLFPDGFVGQPYPQTPVAATGGAGRYTFSVSSGSLPPGLTLAGGAISGIPTAAGNFQFTVLAADDAGQSAQRVYSIRITSVGTLRSSQPAMELHGALNGPAQQEDVLLTASGGDVAFVVQSDRPWLRAVPVSGTVTPALGLRLSVTADPVGLASGIHTGTLTVRSVPANAVLLTIPVTLRLGPVTGSAYLSRVVDGAGEWSTSIYLVNPNSAPSSFRLRFFSVDGRPMAMAFNGQPPQAVVEGAVAAGGMTVLLSSRASSPPLLQGWAELTSEPRLGGLAVLRALNSGVGVPPQEVAVPLTPAGLRQFLLPFDNRPLEFTTAMALTNPGASLAGVAVRLTDENGAFLAQSTLTLGPGQQTAFEFPTQFGDAVRRRGLATFVADGEVAALGLRFTSQGAFTALEPIASGVAGVAAGTPQYIPHIAEGGGWRTALLLVSPDSLRNAFQLQAFRGEGQTLSLPIEGLGTVSRLSDAVPAGSMRSLVTPGTGGTVTETGFLELVPDRLLAGLAIFRALAERPGAVDQEAAVPLSFGLRRFLLPFDNTPGLSTSLALVNPHPSQATTVRLAVRNEAGAVLESQMFRLGARQHVAFELSQRAATAAGIRGVAEFQSEDTDVAAIGLRFTSAGPFTALPVLPLP